MWRALRIRERLHMGEALRELILGAQRLGALAVQGRDGGGMRPRRAIRRSALSVVSSSDQSPAVSGISIVIWSCGVRSPCKPSCERVTKLCSVLVCAPSSLR